MDIGIVRTAGSPCRCAEAVIDGLNALGHTYLLADSEEIEIHAAEIAGADLVIDHTDTYRGRGLFRPFVRLLLESHGARVVGSSSQACFLADDKIASKSRFLKAGIPTPPWIVADSTLKEIPPWLRPPLILKPAFEHMSRGLRFARTDEEALQGIRDLLDSIRQPLLVEKYIPGRELGVSILEGPDGLEVLPPVEWRVDQHGTGILSEAFKLIEPSGERKELVQADLDGDPGMELVHLAKKAFLTLGLRDYARFDVRLSPEGCPFFLEANTTPSLEPLEALALSARWAGLDYPSLISRMLSSAHRRSLSRERPKEAVIDLTGPSEPSCKVERHSAGRVILEVPEGVHPPPPSSIDLAGIIEIRADDEVLDLGCGTGLLAIAAARGGARHVVAVDLDPMALAATHSNALRNRVGDRIDVRAGSWFDALEKGKEAFDHIVATPPQTPGPFPFGPRYGGWDGTKHLFFILDHIAPYLKKEGRLWLLAISLANPPALRKRLRERFSKVSLIHETERLFTAEEYEAYSRGLFAHFLELRDRGECEFRETRPRQYAFRNLFFKAEGLRLP